MSQRITTLKGNFTAGELKPALWAREDIASFNNGAKRIENFVCLPEGGVTRRPGTRMVVALHDESETGLLVPFKFSRADARVLVVNGGRAMVVKHGGYVTSGPAPYTFAVPWSAADLPNVRWAEAANDIFIADGAAPKKVKRLADDDWTVSAYEAVEAPTATQNTDIDKTIAVSALAGTIALEASFDIFTAAHVGTQWRLDESDYSLVPYWTASESITTGGAAAQSYRRFQGRIYRATLPAGAASPLDCGVNPPSQEFGDFQAQPGKIIWQFVSLTYGYVRIDAVADARHATATVIGVPRTAQTALPDSLATKPTYVWREPAWSDDATWPALVAFVQQRVAWLGPRGEFWVTITGDYYSFRVGASDADAIFGQVLSIDGSVIEPRWAISNGWIVVGAGDSEPVIRGPGAYDAITQDNVTVITDKGQGSAWAVPAIVDAGVVFIGSSRRRLHYARTDRLIESIKVDELSVAANHVLAGRAAGVVYQHDPHRLLWGWSQDGALWCWTFRPDQQVIAAHRHPMPNAFVESMAAIPSPDGTETEVYLIVRRIVAGVTRRFVEALTPFFESDAIVEDATDAWFVDCGLEYVGPPVETLSGLAHLEGETVRIFLQGQQLALQQVTDGAVSIPLLSAPSIRAVVGLPIPFAMQTLDMSPTAQGRTTRGSVKQATHGAIDLVNAYGVDISCDAGEGPLEAEALFESGAAPLLGAPMPVFTGRKTFPLDCAHGTSVGLIVEGDHAFPLTIIGLTPDIELMEA